MGFGDSNFIAQFGTQGSGGGGGGSANTIYNADDTIGSGRVATLTDTLKFDGTNSDKVLFGVSNYITTAQAGFSSYAIYIGVGNIAVQINGKYQVLSYNSQFSNNYLKLYGNHYIQSTSAGLWTISDTQGATYNIGARFGIETLGSTDATIGFRVRNSSSVDMFDINDASETTITNNVASPLNALTLINEASGSNHTDCGVKLQLTSNADTSYIAQYDSTSGGSNAPTMWIESPTGINYKANAVYRFGYHNFQTDNNVAFGIDRDGNSAILRSNLAGGGGNYTELQLAYTGGDYNFIKTHASTGGKFIFGRENGGSFEYMRIAEDGEVLIGTPTTDASAILNVASTTQGFLPPRMTTTERDLINSGTFADGLTIYNTTDNVLQLYNGTSWTNVSGGGIYGGSGSLSGATTITMGANNLTFDTTSGDIIVNNNVTPDPVFIIDGATNTIGMGGNATLVDQLSVYNANGSGNTTCIGVYGNNASGSQIGIDIGVTASATTNTALTLRANSGTANNYALLTSGGQIGFGTSTPNASALVQIDSTTQGFLPPRMTTAEMNAISTPATALMVYDTTTNQWMGYNGTSWVILG